MCKFRRILITSAFAVIVAACTPAAAPSGGGGGEAPSPDQPEPSQPNEIVLDVDASPLFGETSLSPPTEFDSLADVIGGGDIDVSMMNDRFVGFYSAEPTIRLDVAESDSFRLFFLPNDDEKDATLVISDSSGNWYNDDDEFGESHPAIDIEDAAPGPYFIWVGSFNEDRSIPGTLFITTRIESVVPYSKAYLQRSKFHRDQGKHEQVFSDFVQAVNFDPDNAYVYNGVCWWGSLTGHENDVMAECDLAVKLASDEERPAYLDSRGIARALVGDYQGAIDDFKPYVEQTKVKGIYDLVGAKRELWIAELESGHNPFDPETLNELEHE